MLKSLLCTSITISAFMNEKNKSQLHMFLVLITLAEKT